MYQSELTAVRQLLPKQGLGIEIGVGSGRFAAPLGIPWGVEPSYNMSVLARARGVRVVDGVGEALPLKKARFDFVVMVTTICFLDDTQKALAEIRRVLRPNGRVIIGFVDKLSPLGRTYEKYKDQSAFYKAANFFSVDEVVVCLKQSGFRDFKFRQTIFQPLNEIKQAEAVRSGYGEGSFVVISAR